MASASNLAGAYDLGMGHAPAQLDSSRFDSLQDLLEREGYKETRIITPIGKSSILLPNEELHQDAQPHFSSSPSRYTTIHQWMEGMMAAQTPDSNRKRPALHTTRSEAALNHRVHRQRSGIWVASRSHKLGSQYELPQAVPPLPTTNLAFLAEPAKPVVSRADAIARNELANQSNTNKAVRRTKSQDLLHRALKTCANPKKQSSASPVCNCGRMNRSRPSLSWKRSASPIEPRWHAHDCPVRLHWEMTTTDPITAAPPTLYLSTPSGRSSPRQLELRGGEFDPRDITKSGMIHLFAPLQRPRLKLMKRATVASLYGLFREPDSSPSFQFLSPQPSHSRKTFTDKSKRQDRRVQSGPQLKYESDLNRETRPEKRISSSVTTPTPQQVSDPPSQTMASLSISDLPANVSDDLLESPSYSQALKIQSGKENHRITPQKSHALENSIASANTVQNITSLSPTSNRTALKSSDVLSNQLATTPNSHAGNYRSPIHTNVMMVDSASLSSERPESPTVRAHRKRSELNLRKSSKTRPSFSEGSSKINHLNYQDSTDMHSVHQQDHSSQNCKKNFVQQQVESAQTSHGFRLQRKPSAMALGLGLAYPTSHAPPIFSEDSSSSARKSPRKTLKRSGTRIGGNSANKWIPPVPPLPQNYDRTSSVHTTD
ncbi:hypothetical protein MPSI1_000552 [Malassezia psittaci]|uniref:Uncharacterized protein n=1 Tax=Malassezia psittaci TaxID=1821823 RepID=A0AAF0F6T2_9BASI|nr:hypothetical protein MPSI1_000552 [Malassezia psittaci]